MVSFVCDRCQSTLKKAKVEQHSYSCGSQYYSCVDCNNSMDLQAIKTHNSCISEQEKHQGSMFRGQRVGEKKVQTVLLNAQGKPAKHYLDSTDDEQEEEQKEEKKEKEKEEQPKKKQKVEEKKSVAAASAPVAASSSSALTSSSTSSSSTDLSSTIQSLLHKKGGSLSLKKLRKSLMKSTGNDNKEVVEKMIMQTLMQNASQVKISWMKEDAADEE